MSKWFYVGLLLWIGGMVGNLVHPTNWWYLASLPGGFLVGWFVVEFIHRWQGNRIRREMEAEWTDILNPHGDNTLREGDAVFDAVMRGSAISGTFGPRGWEIAEHGQEKTTPEK